MRDLADASVDACVTDPPYGLTAKKKGGTGVASVNLDSRIGTGNGPGGFMGMKWDSGVPSAETWREVFRVLKPGAHLVAFFGTRTYHRGVVAIEDAGFEIRDQIGWVFGSGFPKSHNGEWGGTALKPAWEPIVLARKPLAGTVEQNWTKHGTGALNIDASRIEYAGTEDAAAAAAAAEIRSCQTDRNYEGWGMEAQNLSADKYLEGAAGKGRWPANLIHDGSDEVIALFPEDSGQAAALKTRNSDKTRNTFGLFAGSPDANFEPHDGLGSAARFFYCAKADREERNLGLHGFTEAPLNWSSGTQSPSTFQAEGTKRSAQNNHPTVKPVDLMRYLCRLVTPKGGVVLDPFMGSGSTGIGALREGFQFIGIEQDQRYVEIATARIKADAPLFTEVTA